MNVLNTRKLLIAVFIAITIAVAGITSSVCSDYATVSVEPEYITNKDRFSVNISVVPMEDEVYGVQYTMSFDPTVLQVLEQTQGTFLCQNGTNTIEIANMYNNTLGTIEYGEMRMGARNGTTVSGVLATITFEVIGNRGSTGLTLSDVIVCDPLARTIPVSVNNGIVMIGPATFDTGPGQYPSIMGVHKGEIQPQKDIPVERLYTYSGKGTGGHSEYISIQGGTIDMNKSWDGYQNGDYHYITFDVPFVLKADVTYYYEIKTGSYPQIHHVTYIDNMIGNITCTEFIDVNGQIHTDMIPAITLEAS